jgi:hypothetical protein
MKKLLFSLACLFALNQQSPDVFAGALRQGEFSVIPYGGMAPATFTDRKKSSYIVEGKFYREKAPDFNSIMKFPFIFGGSIGYNVTNQFEFFGNVDYMLAGTGKKVVARSIKPDQYSLLKYQTGTFGALGTYLGGRYYFDCGGTWYPFVGAKLGANWRKSVTTKVYVDNVRFAKDKFFDSNVVFAGGLQLGLDAELAEYVDFILMAEAIGSGRVEETRKLRPFFNRVGGMFTFPVTAGIRFRMY